MHIQSERYFDVKRAKLNDIQQTGSAGQNKFPGDPQGGT